MPLTKTNLGLMPDGLYENYLTSLRRIAHDNSTALLDLSADQYDDECFYDTVHLNEVGAKSFFGTLSSVIHAEGNGRMSAYLGGASL
jgi:hypothetical protein